METMVKAANGKHVEAITVFSRSIGYLKDEALKVICQRTGDEYYNVSDIQWVLTVPAIWTPVAKQFMREAAYEVFSLFVCFCFSFHTRETCFTMVVTEQH